MNPEIASLHSRMAQGGDWFAFREEIARLHKEARTQEEFVTVLEAHRNLVAVAEHCFPPQQCAEVRQVAHGEYKMFLNVEAMEDGNINPVMLDRITAREVESGRLAPDDGLRTLAASAGTVMGDSADLRYNRKLGDSIGLLGCVVAVAAFFTVGAKTAAVALIAGLAVGWAINEHRRKGALRDTQAARTARGYV